MLLTLHLDGDELKRAWICLLALATGKAMDRLIYIPVNLLVAVDDGILGLKFPFHAAYARR